MTQLLIPASVGELYDKISILEIKLSNVGDNQNKKQNIVKELEALRSIEESLTNHNNYDITELNRLYEELKKVNLVIWDIEDVIRKYEKDQNFGDAFVQCARKVYINNDLRAVIKRRINDLVNSQITEEKIY